MSVEEISSDSIVCWSSAPVATEVNDEVVLMNLERDRCYGLGTTGSDIWRKLKLPIRVSDLSTELSQIYDVRARPSGGRRSADSQRVRR